MLQTTFRDLFANGYVNVSLNDWLSSVKVHVILSSSQVYGWLGFFLRLASSAFRSSHSRDSRKITVQISDFVQITWIHCFAKLG